VNAHLERILQTGVVERADGDALPLIVNTSREQCVFLQRIAREISAANPLEIGLAHGVSAIAIAEACGGSITTVDPYQRSIYQGIGILNIGRAGYSVQHFEEDSQVVLPRLLGQRFDFAYVDTTKVFDMVLVDAFYITRLLTVGGIVVFDDCNWPGVRKCVRYLAHWPHMKVYATFGAERSSILRRVGHFVASIPGSRKALRSELVETDESLGLAAGCIAFQKISEDTRPWNWDQVP
jgi:predicted O-methyltransferase YrrM